MVKKKKHDVFPDENFGKEVKVEFDNQGDINEIEPIVYPDKEQYPKDDEPIIGANMFEPDRSSKPKPKSHQDRLKGLFGEHAE